MESKNNYKSYDKSYHKPSKFEELRSQVDPVLYKKWDEEQKYLKTLLKTNDDFTWKLSGPNKLKYIAGVDISFSGKFQDVGVSSLIVMTFPDFKIVYEDYQVVKLDMPYVPGFLAFREAPHIVALVEKLKTNKPELIPQVILVDGNGIWHQNGCGLASHLGILLDIPTIGCSKTIFYVDGLSANRVFDLFQDSTYEKGDYIRLEGRSGRIWGAAIRSDPEYEDPLIVSIGHKISLQTAIDLVNLCCLEWEPEPIRLADLKSRKVIRQDVNRRTTVTAAVNELKFMKK